MNGPASVRLLRPDAPRLATIVADLADRIRAEHAAVEQHTASSLEHARACGQLLIQAKEEVAHGGWMAWLNVNFPASDRTARLYMRLARVEDWSSMAGLSLRAAGAAVAGAVEADDEGEEPPEKKEKKEKSSREKALPWLLKMADEDFESLIREAREERSILRARAMGDNPFEPSTEEHRRALEELAEHIDAEAQASTAEPPPHGEGDTT